MSAHAPVPSWRVWVAPLLGAAALAAALAAATLVTERVLRSAADAPAPWDVALQPVGAPDSQTLRAVFEQRGYDWPPQAPVPALAVLRLPQDMRQLDVAERKAVFFRALLPLVLAENARIERKRAVVQEAYAQGVPPRGAARAQVERLAERYRVHGELDDPAFRERLLRRIDVLPPALVLAQAANESGWGTSRFALEGNSLFGVWTWQTEQGMEPQRRAADRRHNVRAYADLRSSVRSYYYNLNVGHAYAELRTRRAALRAQGLPLDAHELAAGLTRYSERGPDYVQELRAMMRHNGLLDIDAFALAP